MAANVTIHHSAFSDRRIAYLGELAGYSTMEALGRLAALWSRCTELQTDRPGTPEIRACIGARGEQLLIECGLGEVVDGDVRVRGCTGRTEWYGDVGPGAPRQAAGGKARAASAQRDAKGRLLPASNRQDAGATLDVTGPAHAQQPSGGPASDPDPRSGIENSPARAREADGRRSLGWRAWDRVNAMRAELADANGWTDVQPLHPHDPGRAELAARILEHGTDAEARVEHVLQVAFTEARVKNTVEFLTGSMFEPRSWRKKLGMRVNDVRKPARANGARAETPVEIALRIAREEGAL